MKLSDNTKIKDLKKTAAFGEAGQYLVYYSGIVGHLIYDNLKIADVQEKHGWNRDSVEYGLDRLAKAANSGKFLYHVYADEDCREDKQKQNVNIMFFPKTQDCGDKPFIVICAGGAFEAVCSISEGIPIAARFNEMGYDAFVVTYRVGGQNVMPHAHDDLVASLRYIFRNREEFGVGEDYVLCGFSAGAYLISTFGTDNLGYSVYDLPKPKALIPVYAFIDIRLCGDNLLQKTIQRVMFGGNVPQETLDQYDIRRHLDGYPPCYILCGAADRTVPPENSQILQKCLAERGIPNAFEMGDGVDHGFGEGRGTPLEGWLKRTDAFLSSLD